MEHEHPTFISMLTWGGDLVPTRADVNAAIDRQELRLWARGLQSIVFLPDSEGECAGVMIATCPDYGAAARIATSILGDSLVRVDTVRLDDEDGLEAAITALPAAARPLARQPEILAAA